VDPAALQSQFYQEIENRARAAVIEETKKNAWSLFTLAVAGGALGGWALRGTAGVVLGAGLAYYAVTKIRGT
jgi:hypothetical protein